MKNFLRSLIFFAAALLLPRAVEAQPGQLIYNGQFSGSSNTVVSGATFSFLSGSIVNFQNGTLAANRLLIETNTSGTLGSIGLGAGISVSGGNLTVGSSTSANPTAKVGTSAVNGVLTSFMTSDSAPAIDQTMVPTWTGLHTFAPTAVKTAGTDYGIELTPTLNQRNATNFILIFGNETVTQAGSGNQYLEQLQVGGTNEWLVDSTGTVQVGIWKGSPVGQSYGGAGTINGPLSGNGSGVVALATAGTGIQVTSGGISIAPLVVTNSGLTLPSNDIVLGNGSPDTKVAAGIYTDGVSELLLGIAGTSIGKINVTNVSSGSITLQPTTGALGTSIITLPAASGTMQLFAGASVINDVPSFSTISGTLQDTGVIAVATNQFQINVNDTGNVPFVINNITSGFPQPDITLLHPNLPNGDQTTVLMGKDNGTYDEAWWTFLYSSANSTSNAQFWGFQNATNMMQLTAAGVFTISTGVTSTSTSTGTLVLSGTTAGLGMTGAAFIGTTLNVAGNTTLTGVVGVGGAPISTVGFYNQESVSGGGSVGFYNSPTLTATGNTQTLIGYQSVEVYARSTFTGLTEIGTFVATPTNSGTGTIATEYQLLVQNGSASTSLAGIDVATQTAGTSNNTDILLGTTTIPTGSFGLYQGDSYVNLLTGNLTLVALINKYNNVATAAWGVPAIYGSGYFAAQNAAKASVATYTVGASDGDFEVSAYVNVTTATLFTFTVTCIYTDEGNTPRTLVVGFTQLSGATFLTTLTNATGAGPYSSPVYTIRCKAGTAITIASAPGGTYTTVTYDIAGKIKQTG